MGEVIHLDAAARRFPAPLARPTQQMPYETYLAYQQAEAAFRALHFGRPLDIETMSNRPSAKIVQRHWSTVEELAGTLLRQKSLSREQVTKLLLHASLDAATDAAVSAQP
jgi:hypothetical protein